MILDADSPLFKGSDECHPLIHSSADPDDSPWNSVPVQTPDHPLISQAWAVVIPLPDPFDWDCSVRRLLLFF
jgi:hypothetical protein